MNILTIGNDENTTRSCNGKTLRKRNGTKVNTKKVPFSLDCHLGLRSTVPMQKLMTGVMA
jgi:hypothetical protein